MARPQVHNGFTKIANELLEALAMVKLPGTAMQVLLVILRRTYGFNKKTADISLSQFAVSTGTPKKNINRTLQVLVDMNMIIVKKKEKRGANSYQFNKDFDSWKKSPVDRLSSKMRTVILKNEDSYPQNRGRLLVKYNLNTNKDKLRNNISINNINIDSPVGIALKEVSDSGFNIYQLLNRLYKKIRVDGGSFPDEVLLDVCKRYLRRKEKIQNEFAWFVKAMSEAYKEFRIKADIKFNQEQKTAPMSAVAREAFAAAMNKKGG